MNLKQLEAFVRVAEESSFSKAAKELYLTQPTVSAHITSLEKEFDVRLFVRNTKEVNLSEDGKLLYKYAKQIVDLEQEITNVFTDRRERLAAEKKCITIAASTIPAQYLLPEILAQFAKKCPGEQFKLVESDSAGVVDMIVDHKADVGFTGTVLEKKNCQYIPFYKDELTIIMPNTEKYQKIVGEASEDLSWILDEKFILREEGSGTRKEMEKQLKHAGINPKKLEVIASVANQETIKKSVSQGLGISVLSKLASEEEVREGKLLAFPIPGAGEGRNINVVYNKNYQLSGVEKKFIKIVEKSIFGGKEKS